MKVEIKLHLPDAAAHRHLSSFLAPLLLRTDDQRNLFIDASARPLASASTALHIRLYGLEDQAPSRAVLALKRRPRIDAGVSKTAAPPPSSPPPPPAPFTMIISKKNRREIYLFQEGVLYTKKDCNLAKHPQVDASNLEVIKLMQSSKLKVYVRETFSWQHYYWYLTNDGIEFLRTFLILPSEIVPNTFKKFAKPLSRPFSSEPPGDRPRGPPRFEGDRPRFGDRDGYRGGPHGAPGDFVGEKGGAPAVFQPSFRSGGGSWPSFGCGGGGAFGAGGSSME